MIRFYLFLLNNLKKNVHLLVSSVVTMYYMDGDRVSRYRQAEYIVYRPRRVIMKTGADACTLLMLPKKVSGNGRGAS